MEEQDIDEEELWKELQRALKGACEMFVQTRITEGEHLRDDLISKLDGMLKLVDFITERSPQIIAEYRQKDFLAQEMNREANTILSKSNDLEISNCAIELKTEIEKVREQIQNIE